MTYVHVYVTVCSLLSRGMFLCYGTIDDSSADMIASFARNFSLPYITTSVPVSNPYAHSEHLLYMRPSYAGALIDVIDAVLYM